MKRIWISTLVALGLAAQMQAAQATSKTTPHRTATTHTAAAAGHSLYRPSSLHDKAPDVYKAKFVTTQGEFVVQVHRDWAPLGADRFYNLVKYGFYTDASFFRVIPGFMVQFGIPAKPAIARAWEKANLKDDPVTQHNQRGYITFATAGPNTRTTQVFINFADNSGLDGQGFAPFGQVIEGMEIVDKLYSGYGEGAPQGNGPAQDKITSEGKVYLDKNFPKLDHIKSAAIVP